MSEDRCGGIAWGALMRAAIRERGLLPAQFWALTPAELMLLLGRDGGGVQPMARERLEELAAAWPDKGSEDDHGRD